MTSTPLQIAQRAFNLVGKYVFNEDLQIASISYSSPQNNRMNNNNNNNNNKRNQNVESKAWGRSMKSTVVFDLAYRDFDLALQKEPKNLCILIWYATCIYWNTRYVSTNEKKQLLDAKANMIFETTLSNCKLKVNANNSNGNNAHMFLPSSALSFSPNKKVSNSSIDFTSLALSKADILFIWADILHRESKHREGWNASIMLQKAVEKIQIAYELNPDTNKGYSSKFLLWHKILADQEQLLNQTT